MKTTLGRNDVAAFLREQDHFCLLSHRKPDGDTVGSTAALCRILRKLGKTAHVLRNPEITPRYAWLHEGLTKEEVEPGDTLVTVDVASPGMLPLAWQEFGKTAVLRIDHHETATSFTKYELVAPTMGACAEIIYDLMDELGPGLMDQQVAEAIYVGTATDTGCFRFANTTVHSFLTAAHCAAANARIFQLNQMLFETNTLSKLKIQSWIIQNMQLLQEGKAAIVAIPREVEEAIGVTEDDMDNISNFPRTVEGVCLAATLRETPEGNTKLSVRAVPGWDAAALCAKFGGGGHKGAAGASLRLPLAEAAKAVETLLLEL